MNMRITVLALLMVCLHSSILKAKQKSNQSSASLTEKSPYKKRGRHRRKSQKYAPHQDAQNPHSYLSVPTSSLQPIIITHRTKVHEPEQLSFFFPRIEFTYDGITTFFKQSFNRTDYNTTFLPHNLSHLEQFIHYAHQTQQSPEFLEGVLRLFNQKIKMTPYISAPALEETLTALLPYCIDLLAEKELPMWHLIKDQLITFFTNQFSFLQDNPLGFFDHVSHELATQLQTSSLQPEKMRYLFLRLLTTCYDKLIWSPTDQEKTWQNCKKLGELINLLHTKKVIPDELDANDIYWSLLERYTYFLDLMGSKMTLETCALIKQDLQSHTPAWLNTPEQEETIQTKKERLITSLLDTEIKIRAQQQNLSSYTETHLQQTH